ncbi:MAG: 30S ribosomal protein S16 [Candidatus Staskawiczbacteria bacterium]|nr:30S ribosomal protein S16 [Candidatus Staskawiczbacteria bacterium]
MLTIRLTRKGKKNQPFFRVVLVDKRRSSTGGRSVEDLGYIDPLKKRRSLNAERIKYWISKGAQTSVTMHNLLVTEKVIDEPKIKVSNISKKKQKELADAKTAAETAAKAAAEKPVEAEKPAEEAKPAASAEGSVEPKEEKPAA